MNAQLGLGGVTFLSEGLVSSGLDAAEQFPFLHAGGTETHSTDCTVLCVRVCVCVCVCVCVRDVCIIKIQPDI